MFFAMYRVMTEYVKDIINIINASLKRLVVFAAFQQKSSKVTTVLTPLCPTRWTTLFDN